MKNLEKKILNAALLKALSKEEYNDDSVDPLRKSFNELELLNRGWNRGSFYLGFITSQIYDQMLEEAELERKHRTSGTPESRRQKHKIIRKSRAGGLSSVSP